MKHICVFCGSNTGDNPIYTEAAKALGRLLADQNRTLIYGAGNIGLMGVIADATLEAGGKVVGVIPRFLKEKEVCHQGLTELIVVETMHERKKIMADRSEGFIAMPGGFGTMDEVCEILTWAQLGLHSHPVGFLDVDGYYKPQMQMFDQMVTARFLHQKNRDLIHINESPAQLLQQMEAFEPPSVEKWLDRSLI